MEEHKEAMDFDIEDPSAPGTVTNKSIQRSATTVNVSSIGAPQTMFSNIHAGVSSPFSGSAQPGVNSNLSWPSQINPSTGNFSFNNPVRNLPFSSIFLTNIRAFNVSSHRQFNHIDLKKNTYGIFDHPPIGN